MIRTAVRTVITAGVVGAVAVGGVAIGQQLQQPAAPAQQPVSQTVEATTAPQPVKPGTVLKAKPKSDTQVASDSQTVDPAPAASVEQDTSTTAGSDEGTATTQEQTVSSEPTTQAAEPTSQPADPQTTAAAAETTAPAPTTPPTLGPPEQPSPGPHNQ